jgi:hypothetical protein
MIYSLNFGVNSAIVALNRSRTYMPVLQRFGAASLRMYAR